MTKLDTNKFSWLVATVTLSLSFACSGENVQRDPVVDQMMPPPVESADAGVTPPPPVMMDAGFAMDAAAPTPPKPDRGPAELFGAPLSDDLGLVLFEDLIADPESYADVTIQTEGVVRQNCQKRGCWMEVRSLTNAQSETIIIRFLNYGFFVPVDSRGSTARIEGITTVRTLSPAEVDELILEGYTAGLVEKDDGSAVVLSFTATGVMMWGRNDD